MPIFKKEIKVGKKKIVIETDSKKYLKEEIDKLTK
jgi:hypothetical protein